MPGTTGTAYQGFNNRYIVWGYGVIGSCYMLSSYYATIGLWNYNPYYRS